MTLSHWESRAECHRLECDAAHATGSLLLIASALRSMWVIRVTQGSIRDER